MPPSSPFLTAPEHRGLHGTHPPYADRERWFRYTDTTPRRVISLLDADPDFARLLAPEERAAARQHVLVTVHRVERGRWRPQPERGRHAFAFVVLAGTLIRGRRVEDRWSTELLGPEDVLQPWDDLPTPIGVTVETEWTALEPVQLAVLDRRFAAAAGHWDGLLEELVGRALRRSRLLAMLLSVSAIRRLDDRVLVLLRLLADRWGVVTPEGVVLRLKLTHETLARLAGAQRPSISTSISRLTNSGVIERRGRQLVIRHELPPAVHEEVARRRAA